MELSPNVEIREIESEEIPILTDFLYEAIYQPDGVPKVSRTILQTPEIWAYIKEFGTHEGDICLVATVDGIIVGAVWSRRGCSYGKIDGNIPELAISVYEEYRSKGIGSMLMACHLKRLRVDGYSQISLSVDKSNYAVRMYRKFGFETVAEREHDYLMLKNIIHNE